MIRLPITRNRRTIATIAMVLVVGALCWLSWRVGSPLMTEVRTTVTNATSHGLRALAPRGGPVQRMP
jgi:hypothetical protein